VLSFSASHSAEFSAFLKKICYKMEY